MGKKDKEEVAHVDMEQDLKDLNLYDFFPSAQWPPHAPVCPPLSFLCALCLAMLCFSLHVSGARTQDQGREVQEEGRASAFLQCGFEEVRIYVLCSVNLV